MTLERVAVVAVDIFSAYGRGGDVCWNKLLKGNSAVKKNDRFPTDQFISQYAALCPGLSSVSEKSFVMQMLEPLLDDNLSIIPDDAKLLLATTTGEIDYLEKGVLNKTDGVDESNINNLLIKLEQRLKLSQSGMIISAACASANTAIANGASLIANGQQESALIVSCDCVSEFVYSGFSSLHAMDDKPSKPFDQNRNGLSIGEGAGVMILMSESRAKKENRPILGYISGWGMSNDANHMTGPSRDGSGLASAITKALSKSGLKPSEIDSISAHGTGTQYNDSMEMKAFKSVFETPVPTYSIKGGTGHTMGVSGMIEAAIALKSLESSIIPPSTSLETPAEDAQNWVTKHKIEAKQTNILSVNAGFGGINVAILLTANLR